MPARHIPSCKGIRLGWLLTQNRIQCKTSLVRKNILDNARCEICGLEDETVDHIISGCNFVCGFWTRIGWAPEEIAKTSELWRTKTLSRVHSSVAHPLLLLYCWEIWRHHNEVIFRHLDPNLERLVWPPIEKLDVPRAAESQRRICFLLVDGVLLLLCKRAPLPMICNLNPY